MNLDKKYYIEFAGAHGAGKTFIYHAIAKQQLLKPYKSIYPAQVKRSKLHFILSCPIIAFKNFFHILFILSFFFRYAKLNLLNFKVLRVLIKMIILHPYYYHFDFNVFLKDDMLHMTQRIIFKKKIDLNKVFNEYLTHFSYLYDGLIFVDIEKKIMRNRFKKRFPGKSEAFKKNRAIIHERVKKQSKFLRKVVTSQTKVPFLIINGSDDVNQNVQKIILFFNQRIIRK